MTSPIATCPACKKNTRQLIDWQFSGLGESVFNYIAKFYTCEICGLAYIGNVTDEALAHFYKGECAYFTSDHFDTNSKENIRKYEAYRKTLESSGLTDKGVLDVGCGRGGFLQWLKQNGWKGACCGIDADVRSIPSASKVSDAVVFKQGLAFDLPVADESQDVITYFHVLEHLRDLDRAVKEGARVLKPSGHMLIEVPDAENYHALPIGPAFWIGIREHVNHFSSASLAHLLQRNGFQVKGVYRSHLPTPEFTYPSLMVLAQKSPSPAIDHAPASGEIENFVKESHSDLRRQADKISEIMGRYGRIVFWGCSAQLFSLLPLLDLTRVKICDGAKTKQGLNYQGMSIVAPEDAVGDGALIIAPYLHRDAIKRAALAIGWDPSNIYSLGQD